MLANLAFIRNRGIHFVAFLMLAALPLSKAKAADGDVILSIMGAEESWIDAEYVGHAFLCMTLVLKSSLKEDCYGFYPRDGALSGVVGGPGVALNEWQKRPERFSRVVVTVQHKISISQRYEVLNRLDVWNTGHYQLITSNCIDLVHDIAGVVGMRRPDRSKYLLPKNYVQALADLNP